MGKFLDLVTDELGVIIREEVDDEEFAEALEVELLFGEAMAAGKTSYDVQPPQFKYLAQWSKSSKGKSAEKKGFIDIDAIADLKQWRAMAEAEVSATVGSMLWKRDKVYIKDQRDFFKIIGVPPTRMAEMIKDQILREWHTLGNLGLERDEPEGEEWHQAVRAGEKSKVTIRPVKSGKSGVSGWAVEMKPGVRTILRAFGLNESLEYLAKVLLGEGVLTPEGELTEQRAAPGVMVDLFSKASGTTVDKKAGRLLGRSFLVALRKVLSRRITPSTMELEVNDTKTVRVGGEEDISYSIDHPIRSRRDWEEPPDYGDTTAAWKATIEVPTEVSVGDWFSLGIPEVVKDMSPTIIKVMGREAMPAVKKGLARAILANPKALRFVMEMLREHVKQLGLRANRWSNELRGVMTDETDGDPWSFNGSDIGWVFNLKRPDISIQKGGKGGKGGSGSDISAYVAGIYNVTTKDVNGAVKLDVDAYRPPEQEY